MMGIRNRVPSRRGDNCIISSGLKAALRCDIFGRLIDPSDVWRARERA
jgi:hypothetical protein